MPPPRAARLARAIGAVNPFRRFLTGPGRVSDGGRDEADRLLRATLRKCLKRREKMKKTLVVITLLIPFATFAQNNKTFYDSSGRVAGRAITDTQGRTTFYDASGRVTGRAIPDTHSRTTFYDASGRVTGRTR